MKRSRRIRTGAMGAFLRDALLEDATGFRNALGRFKPKVRPAVVVVRTRQQIRNEARQAAKVKEVSV